jgi:hypothetical protein
MYAPVFGDLTILIALVNLFEAVCNDATVFFAMSNEYLQFYQSREKLNENVLKFLII